MGGRNGDRDMEQDGNELVMAHTRGHDHEQVLSPAFELRGRRNMDGKERREQALL